jgi:hypothetical protein
LHLNPQYSEFELSPGAIEPQDAKDFRDELLKVISDDRYSFGYLYYLLASEINREASTVFYECVPFPDEISYAIKFDIDEVKKEIEAIDDLSEKLSRLMEWKEESIRTKYNGELKTTFNKWIDSCIENIEKK